jgi:phosphonate transport system substrate-binding protein
MMAFVLSFCLMLPFDRTFAGEKKHKGIHIGLTPVILTGRTSFLNDWQDYLSGRLGQPVRFVQRQTYREIVELLLGGDLDAAWLCGYPYVQHRDELELLAVPVFQGQITYYSYLIVPEYDRQTNSLIDLKGKVFAYSDPDSNSGFLYPQVALIRQGIKPRYFFSKTFFTWSHRDVVKAVADGVAQGGAVDSYVWETMAVNEPDLVKRTRVVSKSPAFGFPPLVILHSYSRRRAAELRSAFIKMVEDKEGKALLRRLNLDGFAVGPDAAYETIAAAARLLETSDEARRYQLPH